jgi:hypothetical protein
MLGTLAILASFLVGAPAAAGDRLEPKASAQAAVGTHGPVAPELPPAVPATVGARLAQKSRLISRNDPHALEVGVPLRFVVVLPEASLYEAPGVVPRPRKASPNSQRGPPSSSR